MGVETGLNGHEEKPMDSRKDIDGGRESRFYSEATPEERKAAETILRYLQVKVGKASGKFIGVQYPYGESGHEWTQTQAIYFDSGETTLLHDTGTSCERKDFGSNRSAVVNALVVGGKPVFDDEVVEKRSSNYQNYGWYYNEKLDFQGEEILRDESGEALLPATTGPRLSFRGELKSLFEQSDLFSQMKMGLGSVSKDKVFAFIQDELKAMLKKRRAELSGEKDYRLVPKDLLEEVEDVRRKSN